MSCHAGKHPGGSRFGIDDHNTAAASRQGIETFQQHGIVGPVEAWLHNHKAAEGAGWRNALKLLECRNVSEVSALGNLRVTIQRPNDMDVAVAPHDVYARKCATTASPVSRVPKCPPMSAVDCLAAIAAATAFSIDAAATSNVLAFLWRPCQASSIAADKINDSGFAMFFPAISGAEPCAACAIP